MPSKVEPRSPTVAAGSASVAVSDQARSDPSYNSGTAAPAQTSQQAPEPGQPFHRTAGFGAQGTDGAPPRSALAYRPEDAQTSSAATTTPVVPPEQPRNGELAANTPSSPKMNPLPVRRSTPAPEPAPFRGKQ